MDITKEALQYIADSAKIEKFEFNGLEYTSKQIYLVKPPLFEGIKTKTLTSLLSLLGADFEFQTQTSIIFHVQSEKRVSVYASHSDQYGRRLDYATASLEDYTGFPFGTFLSQEQFIIGLQSHFLDSEDRKLILSVVSKLASDDKLTIEDNGIAQTATVKSGVALVDQVDIKPRVLLKPFRTFREVVQPPSEFILRIRKQGAVPTIALFEADGGEWKLEAMHNVAEYLSDKLKDKPDTTVIY